MMSQDGNVAISSAQLSKLKKAKIVTKGASIFMSTPLSSGACNSCHSPSSSPLGLD
ncbi:MAG: hypothetical protein ACKOGD_07055 [Sphingomonadales bacterium]